MILDQKPSGCPRGKTSQVQDWKSWVLTPALPLSSCWTPQSQPADSGLTLCVCKMRRLSQILESPSDIADQLCEAPAQRASTSLEHVPCPLQCWSSPPLLPPPPSHIPGEWAQACAWLPRWPSSPGELDLSLGN